MKVTRLVKTSRRAENSKSFSYWLDVMEMSNRKAAEALDIHYNTVAKYRREGCPYYIYLACKALYHRLDE